MQGSWPKRRRWRRARREAIVQKAEKDFERQPEPYIDGDLTLQVGASATAPIDLHATPFEEHGMDLNGVLRIQGEVRAKNIARLELRIAILEVAAVVLATVAVLLVAKELFW